MDCGLSYSITVVPPSRPNATSLGNGALALQDAERATSRYRRSLWFVEDLPAGAAVTAEAVRALRPGDGLAPKHLASVLGRRTTAAIEAGTPVQWDLIDGDEA